MTDKWLNGPVSISDLLLYKKLEPLGGKAHGELTRIQALDTREFNEADVREAIIAPLLRVLGYDDSSDFSPKRELHLDVLGTPLRADYALRFWKENFWVLEAKPPQGGKFSQKNLLQGLQYAVHPDVNASLIVLCDGEAIEVFDRDVSLSMPMLRIERASLAQDIDKLRSVLGPWQLWFFQKRRIARLIDKVFDREFNASRVDEFRDLVERRLDDKSIRITQNFQALMRGRDEDKELAEKLRRSDIADLVDGCLHLTMSNLHSEAVTDGLVEHCRRRSFPVLLKLFPDEPEAANANYYGYALLFLLKLEHTDARIGWMPAYLGQGASMSCAEAIRRLIGYCLTQFRDDPGRRYVQLYSAAVRRILKLLFVSLPDARNIGILKHAVQRYSAPELSVRQFTSSPEQHLILGLDGLTQHQTRQFVRECQNDCQQFDVDLARSKLREALVLEARLLQAFPGAVPLMRKLGEMLASEVICTTYDQLGHLALCMLNRYPHWKAYVLKHHYDDVETLVRFGSWQARHWLSDAGPLPAHRLRKTEVAERFFLGEVDLMTKIRDGYGHRYAMDDI